MAANGAARGWRGYLMDGPTPSAGKVIFYCPGCALAEFGPLPQRTLSEDE